MDAPLLATLHAKRLRAIVDVARAAGLAGSDERYVAQLVADASARLVGDGATLWLRSVGRRPLVMAGSAHRHPRTAQLLRQGAVVLDPAHADGVLTAVLESGAAALLEGTDLATYTDDATLEPWLDLAQLSCVAVLALRGEGSVAGVLVVTRDPGGDTYTEDDLAFLQALGDTAAASLNTGQLLAGSAAAAEDMRRQADLVDQVSDVIMAWDADYRIITWNASAERVYLYSAADALGCDAQTLLNTAFYGEDAERVDREDVLTELAVTGVWNGELRQRRADGQEIEVLCSVTGLFDLNGDPNGAVAVNRDVTEQRRKEQMALYDTLTGLPNRRFLLDHLGRVMLRPNVGPLAVFFLDLNGFKAVNDTLGHEAGDEVLRVTAQRVTGALRRNDVVARLGGDEFVAVTEQVGGHSHAAEISQRILAAAGEPIAVGEGGEVIVLPSIGVALIDPGPAVGVTPDQLIKAADRAMYVAKRSRSGFVFADEVPPEDPGPDAEQPVAPGQPVAAERVAVEHATRVESD